MSTASELPVPITIPIAGVSYRQGVVRNLNEGEHVILKRDHDNEFDENAVAIYTLQGDHIGFAPAAIAKRLVDADHSCERWGGQVMELLVGKTWGVRVRVTHSNVRDYPSKPKQASYIQPMPADIADEDLPDDVEGPMVFSRSGRLLGQASDYDAEAASVRVVPLEGGEVRLFPAGVVTVKEAHAVR